MNILSRTKASNFKSILPDGYIQLVAKELGTAKINVTRTVNGQKGVGEKKRLKILKHILNKMENQIEQTRIVLGLPKDDSIKEPATA